jgi:hypothetical protein
VKRLDVEFDEKLKKLFEAATAKGSSRGTPAMTDRVEYWAQGVMAYFNAASNRDPHSVNTRERLKEHDPGLYGLVNETMAYEGHVDWRFRP